jgi:regulator of cell morphogenesis and NO signaling
LRRELPELVALAERVESRHGEHDACPRGLKALLEAMQAGVFDHLVKEERVLFPMILEGYGPRAGGPVRVMELEHDEHQSNLARVRELTGDLTAPPDACSSWQTLYARLATLEAELLAHMQLENSVLFPRALGE